LHLKEAKKNEFLKLNQYINQYKSFRDFYYELIKCQKRKQNLSLSKILDIVEKNELDLSE
jgi:hypothetical protein